MIEFFLVLSRQGRTRLSCYYTDYKTPQERAEFEEDIRRRCLANARKKETTFVELSPTTKLVYRRYAALFFVIGSTKEENNLALEEFVHCYVETLNTYFTEVCELDFITHVEECHYILDEMCMNGQVVDASTANALAPLKLMNKVTK